METRKIKEKVRKILNDCNVYSAPVPIADIAEKYGFVVFETFLEDESGFLLISKEGISINGKKHKKVIAVNSVDTPFRKRFTIAHELGHYFLEVYENEEKLVEDYYVHREINSYNNLKREKEADKFAAELLMPTEFVEYEIKRLNRLDLLLTDIPQFISNKFQVSYSSARYRLSELERRF